MELKDLREDNGVLIIEDLYGFMQEQTILKKQTLILLKDFINKFMVKTFQAIQPNLIKGH